MGIQVIHPVRHVSGIRYNQDGAQEGGGAFQQALEAAKERRAGKENPHRSTSVETLERMGGMNQYDRYAREIFYAMSSETDYKC